MRRLWPIVVLLSVACSYGNPPPRIVAGRQFSLAIARQLKTGTSEAEVRAALGAPLRVSVESDRELWYYEFETKHKERIKFLGVIPWPAKERGGKISAKLTFRNRSLSEVETPVN